VAGQNHLTLTAGGAVPSPEFGPTCPPQTADRPWPRPTRARVRCRRLRASCRAKPRRERERERRGGWWRGKVRPLKVPAGAEARSKGRAARPGGEPPFWHRPPARHHGGGQRRGRGPRCVFKAALGSARQVGRRHVMVLPPASNSTLLGVFFLQFLGAVPW
jgi:hypothetical protein